MHLFHHVLIHATHITKIYVGILNSTALTLFAYNSLQSLKECCSSTLVGEVQPQLLSPNSGSGDLWGGRGRKCADRASEHYLPPQYIVTRTEGTGSVTLTMS